MLMFPTIMLTAEEAIRMVPHGCARRPSAWARRRTQVRAARHAADGDAGILTGVMLAVARAAGETAPLLFTALFSNYWLMVQRPHQLDAADRLAGRADLQLLQHAVRRTRSRSPGPPRWCWSCSCSSSTSIGQSLSTARDSAVIGALHHGHSCKHDPRAPHGTRQPANGNVVIDCRHQGAVLRQLQGGARHAASPIKKNTITAFIGPSGCGKSTVLRCLNRMNDLVRGFRFEGHVHFRGKDIYDPNIDPVAVRRYIGMVFQQPNPFAMSIYSNVAFGLRLNGYKGNMAEQGRAGAARRRAVGRGQGQAAHERPVAVRRPAAAAVHRPRHRHRAGSAADGRALLGARPDRHAEDRGADAWS